MERFKLTFAEDLMCTVSDSETGVSITFREGLFNETQKVTIPESVTQDQVEHMHTTMREFGDWMAQNHYDVAMCNKEARCNAIWTLANEKYWLALADALNGVVVDWADDELTEMLFNEMDDYFHIENSLGLTAAEQTNLLGSISLMEDSETNEIITIVQNFWQHRTDESIDKWASDLLWWPAWCPEEEDE